MRTRDAIVVVAMALLVNGLVLGMIAHGRPEYLRDYRTNANPDARHYVLLGHNVLTKGQFSRNESPPYVPDVMRTPVYPLVCGAIDLASGGILGVYLFQIACHAGTAVIVYVFCKSVADRTVALLAGLLVSSDAMLAISNFEAMSEPLFVLLTTFAVLYWVHSFLKPLDTSSRLLSAVIAGFVVGLAILTRPTALYLPFVMAAVEGGKAVLRRSRHSLTHAATLLGVALLTFAPWVLRNYLVFGVPRLTTMDAANLVYFAGAGAYSIEHGVSVQEAQERIRQEYNLASFLHTCNHWLADRDVKVLYDEQRAAVPKILLEYPKSLLVATVIGGLKATVSHNAGSLANMCGRVWVSPGLGSLLRGEVMASLGRLRSNGWLLVATFTWQVVLSILVFLGALVGGVSALRQPSRRPFGLPIVLTVLYFGLTIAVVGLDAYCRHRSMMVPFWCIFASFAFCDFARRTASLARRQRARGGVCA